MAEFEKATVTQWGKTSEIKINDKLPYGIYHVANEQIRVYLKPPHIDQIDLATGGSKTFIPTDQKSSFEFGNDLLTNLSYIIDRNGELDRTIYVNFESSKQT
jgi:hypothetical protein